jgi:hypothetical protein
VNLAQFARQLEQAWPAGVVMEDVAISIVIDSVVYQITNIESSGNAVYIHGGFTTTDSLPEPDTDLQRFLHGPALQAGGGHVKVIKEGSGALHSNTDPDWDDNTSGC